MVNITRAADLLEVGANGGGWTSPLGTSSPGDPAIQPLAPWTPLGAISEDGLTQGFDEDSQSFTPWGYTSPIRTTITSSLRTFGLTVWETGRVVVQSLQYRVPTASLAPTSGLTTFAETASPEPDRRAFWFVVLDGDNFQRGFYVPEGRSPNGRTSRTSRTRSPASSGRSPPTPTRPETRSTTSTGCRRPRRTPGPELVDGP